VQAAAALQFPAFPLLLFVTFAGFPALLLPLRPLRALFRNTSSPSRCCAVSAVVEGHTLQGFLGQCLGSQRPRVGPALSVALGHARGFEFPQCLAHCVRAQA